MKLWIYILSGITFASGGWNLSQSIIDSIGWFQQFPEIAQSACIAASLSAGTVLTEIFLSNPTRFKLNLRRLGFPVATAAALGFLIGLFAGGISQFLLIPQIRNSLFFFGSTPAVRIIRWMIIGIAVGATEGLSWRWRSVESGKKSRSQQRLKTNILAGMTAGVAAAIIFEFVRLVLKSSLKQVKEDFQRNNGFSILGFENFAGLLLLGMVLGVAFYFAISPSYVAALRAGEGFEFSEYNEEPAKINKSKPIKIKDDKSNSIETGYKLEFVSKNRLEEIEENIEEGLSTQLPPRGTITIGSATGAHICIPGLPLHIADLDIEERATFLRPNKNNYQRISINGKNLTSASRISLKHNSIVSFYCEANSRKDDKKRFRFVFYNRFLDPEG
ncbi:hypothetical protein [Nostoc sp. ATCC 53789]|uniref:hypothetical protein n=1 Tax=Nostoc sp. ATCC 53789 TaxID=76335 RepID=UPI000DECAE91|nr:hypothetical protein [Nostoc sp. ATCC 53789]QHG21169.1 hypothetical protein GJB62_35575 [Nostoc sp. ATCC 53789]RCJ19457.1 hypothetical protein A6V25_26800 [Nostoc sp. ATCC 53789]